MKEVQKNVNDQYEIVSVYNNQQINSKGILWYMNYTCKHNKYQNMVT